MIKKNPIFLILLLFLSYSTLSQNNFKQDIVIKLIDSIKKNTLSPRDRINLLENNLEKINDPLSKIEAYTHLAESYLEIEVYDQSYEYNSIAAKIADSLKNYEKLGNTYKELGKIQMRIKNYESSLDFHKKSLAAFKKTKNRKWQLLARGNIAIIQSKIGPIEQAILTLKNLSTYKELSQRDKSTCIMTLGNIYLEDLKLPLKAIEYYHKSLQFAEKIEDEYLQIILHQNIAESYIALKKYNNALTHNKKSEILLNKNQHLALKVTLHQFYAQIYEGKKAYTNAYNSIKLYQKLKDSLDNKATQLKIANINTAMEIEKHKTDVELQQNTIKALENEKFIDKLKTTILLISLVLLTFLTYWFIMRSKQKIKTLKTEKSNAEDRLDFNKTKVQKMGLNISTSQEYVASFSEKIKDTLSKITDKKSKEEITKLLRDIQSYKIINDNKKELKTYLNKINDEYLYNLTTKYPALTKEEQQLCSLIFLNLKNKDIANILNLSVRSIENKRYRIRKKMELSTNESLLNSLNNL